MAQESLSAKGAHCTFEIVTCTVRFRGMGTDEMGTILTFASVPLEKWELSCLGFVGALTVCFTYPVLYRVSAESRAGEWEL